MVAMTNEDKLREVAEILVRGYGNNALEYAKLEAERFSDARDQPSAIVWYSIAIKVTEVLGLMPRADERIH